MQRNVPHATFSVRSCCQGENETKVNDERAQKQWNTELDRDEEAIEVANPTGRTRNPDQKFKPPPIVRSKRQSGQVSRIVVPNCCPVDVWQREKKETLDPQELKTKNTEDRFYTGIYHTGSDNVPGMIWCGDFERHFTEKERELAHSNEPFRDGKRVSAHYDDLAAQCRRDVEVEDGVGGRGLT